VHFSLIEGFNEYGQNQMGLLNWCKINTSKVHEIPTGYNSEFWNPVSIERDIDFLTVGIVNTKQGYLRKGLDRFLKMADLMPEYKFVVIGINLDNNDVPEIPTNLEFHIKMDQANIKKYMNRTKVYCQFSIAEGLPNTLLEAILMGCYPCVTAVNGMADLKVNKILIRDEVNPEYLEKSLRSLSKEICYENRNFVMNSYSLGKRSEAFKKILK
jgi:glycosyltransferase involved in cell wall biosynthesis